MQAISLDKGAEGRWLRQQIDSLQEKGLIGLSLHDIETEVRHFGNFSAHPGEDMLNNVSREDARTMLELTQQFLGGVYAVEEKVQSLRARRQPAP